VLLAIDVGNSETKLGVFATDSAGYRILQMWRLGTARRRTADEIGISLAALFRRADLAPEEIEAIEVSSVVPQNDRELAAACRAYIGREPRFFAAAAQRVIEVATERPREVGSDLICGAIAARERHGAPTIVVGFGTATTFSAVSRAGAYLGAAIAPGIQISIDALVERTAKLPQVALEAPPSVIGKETVSALQSGIVFGFVGQTEGMVARLKAEIGEDARVVATGGMAEVVARHTAVIDFVEPHLVLDGLRLLFERERHGGGS
jgi:type III pantothenate kinase